MKSNAGSSLVEAIISTGVMAFGALGVSILFVHGPRMQALARDGSTANGLAVARLEQLRILPPTAAERADGGSLTSDVANHFATSGLFRIRWVIADGPAGTKEVTVRAWSGAALSRPAELKSLLWR